MINPRGVVKRGRRNHMKNRKIDKKPTKQVVIDIGYHKLLKQESAESGRTIKAVLEECLSEYLTLKKEDYAHR